MPVECF